MSKHEKKFGYRYLINIFKMREQYIKSKVLTHKTIAQKTIFVHKLMLMKNSKKFFYYT